MLGVVIGKVRTDITMNLQSIVGKSLYLLVLLYPAQSHSTLLLQ